MCWLWTSVLFYSKLFVGRVPITTALRTIIHRRSINRRTGRKSRRHRPCLKFKLTQMLMVSNVTLAASNLWHLLSMRQNTRRLCVYAYERGLLQCSTKKDTKYWRRSLLLTQIPSEAYWLGDDGRRPLRWMFYFQQMLLSTKSCFKGNVFPCLRRRHKRHKWSALPRSRLYTSFKRDKQNDLARLELF